MNILRAAIERITAQVDYQEKTLDQSYVDGIKAGDLRLLLAEASRKQALEEGVDLPPTLRALQLEIRQWTEAKGWADDRSVGDLMMLMVTEVAEAYEEYRNNREPLEVYVVAGKPEGIPIELADVVIRILSFCGKYNIDLQDAVLQKMAYNETRPHRHGGKRV